MSKPDRFLQKLQVFIVKSAIFVCKIWIAQKIFNFLVPWYALHAPFMENKENCRFKKQGKDPSCKGLPSYNRGKGKGRQGSLPFHINSSVKAWKRMTEWNCIFTTLLGLAKQSRVEMMWQGKDPCLPLPLHAFCKCLQKCKRLQALAFLNQETFKGILSIPNDANESLNTFCMRQ